MRRLLLTLALLAAMHLWSADKLPPDSFRLTITEKTTGPDLMSITLQIEAPDAEALAIFYPNGGKLRTKLEAGKGIGTLRMSVAPSKEDGFLDILEKVESTNGGVASGTRRMPKPQDLSKAVQIKVASGIYKLGHPLLLWNVNHEPVILMVGKWDDSPVPPPVSL